MNLKSIASRAKSAIYAEEVPAEQPQEAPVLNQPRPAVTTTMAPLTNAIGDSAFYNRIVAATDYTSNDTVSQLLNGARRLESLIPDRTLRMKAVLAQTGFGLDAILAAVDASIRALGDERTKFEESVKGSREQLEKQKAEVADLEAKLTQAREAIASSQSRLSTATAGFNSAEIRRKTELEQARAEFASLK